MGGAQAVGGYTCNSCAAAAECTFCRPSGGSPSIARIEKKELKRDVSVEAEEGGTSAQQLPPLQPEACLRLDFDECLEGAPRAFGDGPRPPRHFRSGSIYRGQWRGCARHGFGQQSWLDGSCYEGQWVDSVADGLGRFMFPDGGLYIGQWRGNKPQGLGTYYDVARAVVYRGEWQDGRHQGLGVEERDVAHGCEPSATYSGSFGHGVKEGFGVCAWSDGGEYSGQWLDNAITGHGAYSCKSRGRRYLGQWLNSLKHGVGFYDWPDGRCYQGHYSQDEACGFGIFVWPNGQRYEGYWEDGKQDGPGRMISADGQAFLLHWSKGRRAGSANQADGV